MLFLLLSALPKRDNSVAYLYGYHTGKLQVILVGIKCAFPIFAWETMMC